MRGIVLLVLLVLAWLAWTLVIKPYLDQRHEARTWIMKPVTLPNGKRQVWLKRGNELVLFRTAPPADEDAYDAAWSEVKKDAEREVDYWNDRGRRELS